MKKNYLAPLLIFSFFFYAGLDLFAARAIALTATAPTINGFIDDVWNTSLAPAQYIDVAVTGTPTDMPGGRWRGMYDATNFYFLIEITDANRWGNATAGNYWNGDAVEICLKNGTPVKRQIGFGYVSNGIPRRYGDYTDAEARMIDVVANYEGKSGYVLEVRIPKEDMLLSGFTTGDELSMEVCLNQTSNTTARQGQLASFFASDSHWNSFANYTPILLADMSQPHISALNEKTSICSNGTDFASLVLNVGIPLGGTATYSWKRSGVEYTGLGSNANNIRPTAAGAYTCDVTITYDDIPTTTTSNTINITANQTCSDFKTSLPIFVVSTNGQGFPGDASKDKRECDVKVIWNGDDSYNHLSDMSANEIVHYDRKAIMRYRGSTSRSFAKKPYAFATGKKDLINGAVDKANYPLLGNASDEDWILFASYGDKSMMRNKIAMELYREMGYYASSMKYVDLFIDGEHQGVYILMEKYERDEGRINITKDFEAAAPNEIGYIVKLDKTERDDDAACWARTTQNCGGSCGVGGCGDQEFETPQRYELAYPNTDAINYAAKKAYIQNFISQFETALNAASTDEDFANIYKDYIDLQTFADYFIIAELTKVSDAYRISMFFTKDANGKLRCTPIWDYDMGFGNSSTHGSFATDTWQYNGDGVNESLFPIPFWWNKLMTNACFKNVVRTRWENFRQNQLSNSNIINKIDANLAFLNADIDGVPNTSPSGRNKAKWSWDVINSCCAWCYDCPWHIPSWPNNYSGTGIGAGKTTSLSSQEVPLMKAWINNRLSWLDGQIMNGSFGAVLDYAQYKDCCQFTGEFGVGESAVEKESVSTISVFVDDNAIISVVSSENDPIYSVFVYDINGRLLLKKENVNNSFVEVVGISENVKMAVVKVRTSQLSESKILLLK